MDHPLRRQGDRPVPSQGESWTVVVIRWKVRVSYFTRCDWYFRVTIFADHVFIQWNFSWVSRESALVSYCSCIWLHALTVSLLCMCPTVLLPNRFQMFVIQSTILRKNFHLQMLVQGCGLGQRRLIYGKFNSYTQTCITIIDYFQITEKEVLLIRYIIIVLLL